MHFAKGGLRRVGWALPEAFTWLEEGIGLPDTFPDTFPNSMHMHFLEEMALLRWNGWALPEAFTWLEEGIGLPDTFPDSMHMHFLEEMAPLRWNGHVLASYCLCSLKSLNHNRGFFHKRKVLSWEPGPEVLFKTKNQPTQKITNE
jgi:hypothetical protein